MQSQMSEAATTLMKFPQYGLRYIWKLAGFSQKSLSSVFHKTPERIDVNNKKQHLHQYYKNKKKKVSEIRIKCFNLCGYF